MGKIVRVLLCIFNLHVIPAALILLPSGVLANHPVSVNDLVIIARVKPGTRQENHISVFIEEVEKRTSIRVPVTYGNKIPDKNCLIISLASEWNDLAAKYRLPGINMKEYSVPEGFNIRTEIRGGKILISLIGNDERGLLFGVGYLLRKLELSANSIILSSEPDIKTTPQYPLRGHQIGYRPKPNSYDGWTPEMMEQYIRELALFGTNAIELIPPRSDDEPTSPHFPIPQIDMMEKMSAICNKYGLDVWIWYPALDDDYGKPETVQFAVDEWGEVFRRLPRVDAVFVPCGDPGRTPPELLFPMLEKQAEKLKKIHPGATWWVAPQGFDQKKLDKFHELILEKPWWLRGIVYGPWTRMTLPDFRKWIPDSYPLRNYPDITHALNCQYPVPEWDIAFGLTAGREPIMPRPTDMQKIFRLLQKHTIGFISYSEGCSDDVNKFIWSSLGWDENLDLQNILCDYSRLFIGPVFTDSFSDGLLNLENNWKGPLLMNNSVFNTLYQFEEMERRASPSLKNNWRFQQALFRTYYDAYIKSRLIYETSLENSAMDVLRSISSENFSESVDKAIRILGKADNEGASQVWREKIINLGEALYNSVRMQLDTRNYKAGRPDGAMLDRLDVPLNNKLWLVKKLNEIKQLTSAEEKLSVVNEIINWKNPGPGGYYDNLGVPWEQPHLVPGLPYEDDPYFLRSPLTSPPSSLIRNPLQVLPQTWRSHVKGLYDTPVKLKYEGLKPGSDYTVRVVYNGGPLRLQADGVEIHGYLNQTFSKLEFKIPAELTADGKFLLEWYKTPGEGRGGWGNEICEVWLMLGGKK